MQCKSCGSEWKSSAQVIKCPFCGADLNERTVPENSDISYVISTIIEQKGIESLKNSKMIMSTIMDMVQGNERDKKLFRIACSNGILSVGYNIYTTKDEIQKDIYAKKALKSLIDEAFLAEENAVSALNILLRGIGEPEIFVSEKRNIMDSTIPTSSNPQNINSFATESSTTEEKQYQSACRIKDDAITKKDLSKIEKAKDLFLLLNDYKDSAALYLECENYRQKTLYDEAIQEKIKASKSLDQYTVETSLRRAISIFKKLENYADSVHQVSECKGLMNKKLYDIAVDIRDTADKYNDESIYSKAIMLFNQIQEYGDSKIQLEYCEEKLRIAHSETLYKKGVHFMQHDDEFSLKNAIECFDQILNYKDSFRLREIVKKRMQSSNSTAKSLLGFFKKK